MSGYMNEYEEVYDHLFFKFPDLEIDVEAMVLI